mgnify:CR=1 FL=1
MKSRLVLGVLVGLSGCSVTDVRADVPGTTPTPAAAASPKLETADYGVIVAVEKLEAQRQQLALWNSETVSTVHNAAMDIMVSCPYNRAGVQVPFALMLGARSVDPAAFSTDDRRRWNDVVAGIQLQVRVYDELTRGVFPHPGPHDFLSRLKPGTALSRAELEQSADPLAATQALVDQVGALVEAYDDPTLKRIDLARETLNAHTDPNWGHHDAILSWSESLIVLRDRMAPGEDQAQVAAMVRLLERLMSVGC